MNSHRLNQLPAYIFADMDRKKKELVANGAKLIDLSVGDPDLATPVHIVEALCQGARDQKYHKYSPYIGLEEFRTACAGYLLNSRKIRVDPSLEILTLIGSKEGIAHIPFAILNDGDIALITSPLYPIYLHATILAGGQPFEVPLLEENNFLPDLHAIPKDVVSKAKVLFLNYPNNPTSACATLEFFKEAVKFAHEHNILICHDAAYIEMTFSGYKAPSILEVDGAKEVAVEFHSLSKTYSMAGWRIGFAAGNREALSSLGRLKTNFDSSATTFVQHAGAVALTGDQSCVDEIRNIYKRRRDLFVGPMEKAGFKVTKTHGTFYIWARPPIDGDFAGRLLEKTGVVVMPGIGFGSHGRDFIRISLTQPDDVLQEAVEKITSTNIR